MTDDNGKDGDDGEDDGGEVGGTGEQPSTTKMVTVANICQMAWQYAQFV